MRGGCGHAGAIAITHMRAHRARENSTRLGRVALTGGPACMEKRTIAIQNRCRWLRGVESLELQEVARTTGPARMCETAVTKTRG